jgi:hypothetical protein
MQPEHFSLCAASQKRPRKFLAAHNAKRRRQKFTQHLHFLSVAIVALSGLGRAHVEIFLNRRKKRRNFSRIWCGTLGDEWGLLRVWFCARYR